MDSEAASQPMAGLGRNSQAAVVTAMMNTSRRHPTIVTSCSKPKSRAFAAAADISRNNCVHFALKESKLGVRVHATQME